MIKTAISLLACLHVCTAMPVVDYAKIKEDIWALLVAYHDTRDGGLGPVFLRLAWHSAGTWDPKNAPHGGSCGATMRWDPERGYYDNQGLKIARDTLQIIKDSHPEITYSDLWILAGYTAVEYMEGPQIDFTPGRPDAHHNDYTPIPEDRLPEWNMTVNEMILTFGRMGLTEREMVALLGGHSVGHTQPENSGFPFLKWDITPLKFDNFYYKFLFDQSWLFEQDGDCGGVTCQYYRNRSWMMLITDMYLRDDARLSPYAKMYADDEALWFVDFSLAFKKLTEFGMPSGAQACQRGKNSTKVKN
eukprot:TRINITY_DN16121_c0_g1_i1.p1 TRINITY_DN16121_c0_g1~~TRINITY_DN16121_c0_g1_i1.p1  ORF type:complete len:303 (+),score=38.48 TRINITY_DN16121_c0_g1_i1:72-980(+)